MGGLADGLEHHLHRHVDVQARGRERVDRAEHEPQEELHVLTRLLDLTLALWQNAPASKRAICVGHTAPNPFWWRHHVTDRLDGRIDCQFDQGEHSFESILEDLLEALPRGIDHAAVILDGLEEEGV